MKGEQFNILENIIKAVSLLDDIDKYSDSLNDKLSECDSLRADFDHIIENSDLSQVNLNLLFKNMKNNYEKRRKIKNDMSISQHYQQNIEKIKQAGNRQFLVTTVKNYISKLPTNYKYRILTDDEVKELFTKEEPKKRGRPKKVKEGV